jgi:uncharacterized membrane protein YfcA
MFDSLYLTLGEPFVGVSLWAVAGVAAIYFVCFVARGAVGFGALAPAVTFTSWLIPSHHAVLLAVIAATIPQLQLLPDAYRGTDWTVARPMLFATGLTTAIGSWIFVYMSGNWLTVILGLLISLVVLLDVTKLLDRLVTRVDVRAPGLNFGLSSLTGLVNGVAGAGGMVLLVVYLKHACRDHMSLRSTTIFLGTTVLCWRFVLTILTGLGTVKLATEAALMLPFVYAGVWLGTHHFRSVSPARYHRWLQGILLMSALGLLLKGILRVF